MSKTLSWSEISCFEYSPNEWYERYVLKKTFVPTPEMVFGTMIDKRIQEDPSFMPQVKRYPIMQHKMFCVIGGIPLVGYADTCLVNKEEGFFSIRDYKTGRFPWTQVKADYTGQLTMYALLLSEIEKIDVSSIELYIDWIPTKKLKSGVFVDEKKGVKTFKTSRNGGDLARFVEHIVLVKEGMDRFVYDKQK